MMRNNNSESQLSRRNFLRSAASGTALLALAPATNLFAGNIQAGFAWSAEAAKFKIHMIGQAHIDPVWLWNWSEGISVVHSTFQSALDRMKEEPDFKFTASSAQFYQWVAENDPAMLKEIRKRADEGRWSSVGGWWVEPDMNIPSGEAMVRQGLYGQLTLQKLLGHRSKIAYNPDSFGHTGNLPQIIKLQGMENYIFMRPGIREKILPSDLFWWEGTDGTKVLTYRIQFGYNDSGSVHSRVENLVAQYGNQPMKSFMAFYGAGDHGGGATKINISSINALKVEQGAPKVIYSTPDIYFKEAREENNPNLPVIKDDLQHHAVGCYTAECEIKKGNRLSEAALVTAEKLTAIGSVAWGAHYPKQELTAAWHKVLFLQFHDSLAGSSLFDHSQSAREGFGYAQDVAHQSTFMAVQKLEWQVATEDPESQYLLVFNPHAWEVTGNIEYDYNWGTNKTSRVDDEKGNALPHQWAPGSSEAGSRKKLVVSMTVPSMGYRQIRLWVGENPAFKQVVKVTENTIENEFVKLHISYNGSIGLLDKVNNKDLFVGGDAGCRAVIIDDPSDTWSHDIKTYNKEIGAFGNATIKILEEGPLRGKIRSIMTYGSSTLTIDWTLYAGSRNPEAAVTLDWHEHLKMVKFCFPVEVDSPVATYETSYGTIVRATNGNEDPGQRWIDVTGKSGATNYGLAVFNNAKYGYSVSGSDMRISVARSAVYAHHNPKVLDMKAEHLWMDQGIQTFHLLLVPHEGNWQHSNLVRIAEELMAPCVPIYQGIHKGTMPKSGSFLSVDAANIIVSSIKQAENGDDLILRCVETNGMAVTANLDLAIVKRKWSGNFRPYEIKTLRLNAKSGSIKEVNLLEE
ncbi:MAG TPA: glycoside hydrolase family 38 C-terminal domain-containing protein [Prolixibacteraceae bacterium]